MSSADINNNAYYGGHIFRVGYPDWNEFSDFNSYQAYMKNNHNLEANSFYADPDFVDPNNGDYHLGLNSPCINNGDNNVVSWDYDIDGEPRVQGKYVDIGADEARRVRRIHDGNDEWYVYIQDAINEASDGDEIVVYPGTYYESVDFGGKAITLSSAEPNDLDVIKSTIIDGNGAANVVETDSNAILKGLTITGGQRGVYCSASTPVISNCIIRDNSGEGIYAESSTITVRNSLIYDNNEGITLQNTDGTVRNDTIVNNANYGIRVGGNIPSISNCILWNNNDDLYNCSATYSCIEDGDSGTGNISSDPCFVNADNNDFHINIHSPCINAGDPNGDYNDQNDIDGQARVIGRCVDIGADEVDINAPEPNGHWWKLDETSGTTAYDSVDNNNGTFNGDDPCWVTGHIGGAADFNDVSDYFSVSSLNTAYTSSSNFTIAGWFKTSQSTGIQTIVGNWSQYRYIPHPGVNLDFYYGWQVIVENKKVVARFGGSSPNTTSDITGTSDVNDGNWHHFAVVHPSYQGQYTPNSVLYVDGQSEGTPGAQYFSYSNTKFRIGDGSYVSSGSPVLKGGPFCGTIDDVMIFNRALTANEVYQLYIAGR